MRCRIRMGNWKRFCVSYKGEKEEERRRGDMGLLEKRKKRVEARGGT